MEVQPALCTSVYGGFIGKWLYKRQSRNYIKMCSFLKKVIANVPLTRQVSVKVLMHPSFIGVTDGGQLQKNNF